MKQSSWTTFSYKSFGSVTDKVVFFFTSLGSKYWLYLPVIYTYVRAGYHVVVYDTSPGIIFDENIFRFLETGEKIARSVQDQVKNMRKKGVKVFVTHGNSMGTLYAVRSAVETPEITKVIINLTYGSLADNIWSWIVMRNIKKRLQRAGITKEQVDEILKPISPIPMAAKLKGKKVLLYLAKNDTLMLYKQSLQFKEALDKAKVDYVYIENPYFGHNTNMIINNFRSKVYLDFLAN